MSSSHCSALLLSHCAGWLLHRLSLHPPLVILSLRCPVVVLLWLFVALSLVAPPSCPLVVPFSCPLIACRLVVAWPPSNDAAATIGCRPKLAVRYCLEQYQRAHHGTISQRIDRFGRVLARGLAWQKQSSYKTEGVGGQFVGGSGKNTMVRVVFAHMCAAGRAKFKNQPTLAHSPGEAACPNVGLFY